MSDANGFQPDVEIRARDQRIGCIGAGMIMAECHLAAYKQAGFPVVAIASRTRANAAKVAERWGIAKVHETPEALIADPEVDIVDIAYPPDQQPALIRLALQQPHVKAVLAQKPLALSLDEAIKLRDEAAAAGKILSVNQNMRYDQSMRVAKQILDSGALGEIVFAEIDMHAIPHWQGFLEGYDRLTLLQHERASSRRAALPVRRPRGDHHADAQRPAHEVRSYRRHHGLDADLPLRRAWRCRWRMSGPARGRRAIATISISAGASKGREGVAKGTIGWPTGAASTLTYASTKTTGGEWVTPTWETMWFPHAFIGVMEQLQHAVKSGAAPALSVADNVKTMALVEAGYRSMREGRTVKLSEISINRSGRTAT